MIRQFLTAAAVLLASFAPVAAQDYSAKTVTLADDLPAYLKREAERWAGESNYYAALVTPGYKGIAGEVLQIAPTFWSRNHHSLEVAKAVAMRKCGAANTIGGPGCFVIATIEPKATNPALGRTVSQTVASVYAGEYTATPGHKAIATAVGGAWGMTVNRASKSEAEAVAIVKCEADMDRRTANPCRVLVSE